MQYSPGLLQNSSKIGENPVEAFIASHSKNNRGANHECELQLNPCINLWIIALGVLLKHSTSLLVC